MSFEAIRLNYKKQRQPLQDADYLFLAIFLIIIG